MTPDNTSTILPDDEGLSRTWRLVAELCSQLANNREQIQSLEHQVSELQSRANEFTGPLIRASIRAPPFESGSEIERQNARLIFENQQLNEENGALSSLVKEYETTLQVVMNKFRVQAYEIQQSKLQMQREYEALVEEERAKTAQAHFDNTTLQSHLATIGSLVRQAYDGQSDLDTDLILESLSLENQGLREMLGISDLNSALFHEEKDGRDSTSTPVGKSNTNAIRSQSNHVLSNRDRIIAEAEKEEEQLREREAEEEKQGRQNENEDADIEGINGIDVNN